MDFKIRKINPNDLDEIAEVEKRCFTTPWSRESFAKEMLNDIAYYIGAEVDGRIIGYVGLWKICDEGHITNVGVLPEYRKFGIGTALIKKIIEICKENEIISATLEVRESNVAALKLYENFGFVTKGKRPNYYDKPKESALIMWSEIK